MIAPGGDPNEQASAPLEKGSVKKKIFGLPVRLIFRLFVFAVNFVIKKITK